MADRRRAVSENVAGDFFVDETCIDCDACRQLAPEVFADAGSYSFVHAQPENAEATRKALRALLACPTGSIGTLQPARAREVKADFPMPVEQDVYYCGFHSPKSYGGASYFVERPDSNWLIDSPKFLPHLVDRFDEMGGIDYIFLTHRDDVAEAEKYAARFSSRRIIHRLELAAQPRSEIVLEGFEPVEVAPGFLAIPTPGHTRGHCCLLYGKRFLFTGDHLWWSRTLHCLNAGRDVCWHSWQEQTRSMARLAGFTFEWVLPGHGERVKLPASEMRSQVEELARRMQSGD
ncbi:MAG TPA: MBL fold metallo-hydrolase [Bryobacteraceae bacterium]|nr:MBL fold metallo-hydrolase [Bryobacteraceae bacterium]